MTHAINTNSIGIADSRVLCSIHFCHSKNYSIMMSCLKHRLNWTKPSLFFNRSTRYFLGSVWTKIKFIIIIIEGFQSKKISLQSSFNDDDLNRVPIQMFECNQLEKNETFFFPNFWYKNQPQLVLLWHYFDNSCLIISQKCLPRRLFWKQKINIIFFHFCEWINPTTTM